MKKNGIGVATVAFALIVFTTLSMLFMSNFAEGAPPQSITDENGVTVFCTSVKWTGAIQTRIKNNGSVAVRVRMVHTSLVLSEATKAMLRVDPGSEQLFYARSSDGFYIYSLNGGLIGWIQAFSCRE